MSTLTWKRGTTEATYDLGGGPRTYTQTVHDTTIGTIDYRIRKVDDLWFIETREGDARFGNPHGGDPIYRSTLREAKADVQRVADAVERAKAKAKA